MPELEIKDDSFQGRPVSIEESFFAQEAADTRTLTTVPGYTALVKKQNALTEARITECSELWAEAMRGNVSPFLLQQAFRPSEEFAYRELQKRYKWLFHETITTSDFSLLTSTVMNRILLKRFPAFKDDIWSSIAAYRTMRDFRPMTAYYMDGMEQELEVVKETEGFNRRAPVQGGPYTMTVTKREAGYGMSWEAVINDDMNLLNDFNDRLYNAAYNTRAMAVTRLFVDTNGPHASLYSASGDNPNLKHGVLNMTNLADAIATLLDQTGAVDAMPLDRPTSGLTLVVGSGALYVVAQNLKETLISDMTEKGGSTNTRIRVNNWLASRFQVLYNPFIRKVASNANGSTSWFLFLNPAVGRPSLMITALQGYENPILYEKAPNSMRVGGGLDTTVGDFEVMSRDFKLLMTLGSTRMDPLGTIASDGTV